MKKLLRIKFENIISILAFVFFTYCMICHQVGNGFNLSNLIYEMMFYYSMTLALNIAIKAVRLDLM